MGAGPTDEPAADGAVHATAARQISPNLPQWELAARLRALREERGLTVEEVAERLVWPPSRIKQLEEAAIPPTETDLHALRALFKLDDSTAGQLTELALDARQPGWWEAYQDLGVPYIGLEQDASSITSYTMQYLPALLQTADYARAIITALAPQLEPEKLEQRIEARLRRQQILSVPGKLHYSVLLDEAVLHRPVGGRAVMHEQLDRVITMIRQRQVDLRITPFERGESIAQDSNFVLLQFDEPGPLPVVYVEGLATYRLLDDKKNVYRYSDEFERLRQSALDPGQSVARIEKARDGYRGDR